jgi:hypothetical protein
MRQQCFTCFADCFAFFAGALEAPAWVCEARGQEDAVKYSPRYRQRFAGWFLRQLKAEPRESCLV